MSPRDWDDPRYKAARAAARRRDGHRCRMCGATKALVVHHVRRWADAPTLRFAVGNLVTLCRAHHARVTGHEEAYAPLLLGLLRKPPPPKKKP